MKNLVYRLKDVLINEAVEDNLPQDFNGFNEDLFEVVVDDEVKKFITWMIRNTTDIDTLGACRIYKNKTVTVDELMKIYKDLEIKEMFKF